MQDDFNMVPGKAGGAAGRADADLQWLCRSVLQNAFPMFRNATVDARFYPYIGLTHTIRRKGSRWVIRISDHCRNAPAPVLEAVLMLLGSKIAHRRPPQRFLQTYELFRKDPSVEETVRERRRRKGRKYIAGSAGKYYSPEEIFKEVNSRFFNGQIEVNRIGWGKRKGWARLGHYDPIHHTITLSPVLDSPKVPEFVVRYIVYHEMLHALFGDSPSRGFRRHHHAEFRRAERAHPDYARAEKFLRDYFGRRYRRIND
jgi:hypothetical protein